MHFTQTIALGAVLFSPICLAGTLSCPLKFTSTTATCNAGIDGITGDDWINTGVKKAVPAGSSGYTSVRLTSGASCEIKLNSQESADPATSKKLSKPDAWRIYLWDNIDCKGLPVGSISADNTKNTLDKDNKMLELDAELKPTSCLKVKATTKIMCLKYDLAPK